MLGGIFTGPRYLLRGFRLITRSGLRRYFIAPLCINIAVFTGLIWLSASWYWMLLDWLLPAGDTWWAAIAYGVLWVIFALAVAVFLFFVFTIVANLIAAPFNALLAVRVAQTLDGERRDHTSPATALTVWGSLTNELRKLVYFLVVMLLALLLTSIPVVNIAAPFVWILVGCWMPALEYLAYPMENDGLRFTQVRRTARANLPITLGFGAAVMVMTLIPVLNLMVMPASVAGATGIWIEEMRSRSLTVR
ncbi:MAG: sulfate transporter CysZ [Acidiferrobacterales bacterium]